MKSEIVDLGLRYTLLFYTNNLMYAIIDGLNFMGGITGFILTLVYERPELCPIPLAWVIFSPFITEGIYDIFASCCDPINYHNALNSRIFYNEGYNLSFCGLEKIHPFDAQKYANIY